MLIRPLCQSNTNRKDDEKSRNPAAVREPSIEYLQGFGTLRDILSWAGIQGDPEYAYAKAGSLLYLMAGDEFYTIESIEFSSIAPSDFDDTLKGWKYSDDNYDMQRGDDPGMNIKPTPIVKARARAAHRAARIWNHIEWSAQACTSYKQWRM